MELGTFGAILKFAIDIEKEVIEFYRTAPTIQADQSLADLFEELVVRGERRIKTLERVRRENTTEMILEPITDFDSDTYSMKTIIPKHADEGVLREIASTIESTLENFYNTASKKIEFLSEAAYALELLAEKNRDTREQLSH
ncbi:hypothetical protein EU527_15070 [Candidatus Thorarchaeota archaeon]|nr:MAG: hypothetical protein EU527_15070 [Candidatus Thorarchaeota archaeon]